MSDEVMFVGSATAVGGWVSEIERIEQTLGAPHRVFLYATMIATTNREAAIALADRLNFDVSFSAEMYSQIGCCFTARGIQR